MIEQLIFGICVLAFLMFLGFVTYCLAVPPIQERKWVRDDMRLFRHQNLLQNSVSLSYCEKYDADFVSETGKWKSNNCGQKLCRYCGKRPPRHKPHAWEGRICK